MDKGAYGRRDRLVTERYHDTYQPTGKYPEPTVCSRCQAVFIEGRWTWQDPPADADEVICPACRRIDDKVPSGFVELRGGFLARHRDEIMNLIRNEEKREKDAHPQERIMAINEEAGHVLITTTGIHVARRLGEALARAYQGEFTFDYGDGEKSIRVSWCRD